MHEFSHVDRGEIIGESVDGLLDVEFIGVQLSCMGFTDNDRGVDFGCVDDYGLEDLLRELSQKAYPGGYNPYLVERDVRALYHELADAFSICEFVAAWMRWKVARQGLPKNGKDAILIKRAARSARTAFRHGVLLAHGKDKHRLIWLAHPSEVIHEQKRSGEGRLKLPPHERGAPRLSLAQRHAVAARPIIHDLLKQIAVHPKLEAIPIGWLSARDISAKHVGAPEG